MKRGQIYSNNELIRSKVEPPMQAHILCMTEDELSDRKTVKLVEGDDFVKKGSEFYGFTRKAMTEKEVRKAYDKLRIKFADATHISCAYRLTNPNGPYDQGYADDQEYGQRRNILSTLKD